MGKVNNTNERNKMISFQDIRMVESGKLKGYLTLCLQTSVGGWINIKSCKLFDGANGFFLAFPSTQDKNDPGKYWDVCWGNKELTEHINNFLTDKAMAHIGGGGKTPWGVDVKGEPVWERPDFTKKKEPKPVYDDELPF